MSHGAGWLRVVTYEEAAAKFRPPRPFVRRAEWLEASLIVYLEGVPAMLDSSRIILVSRSDGQVLYFGSANDEG
jgi:hypothetical protein